MQGKLMVITGIDGSGKKGAIVMLKKGVKEIRDHFTRYLKRVKQDEEIVVTERGKPVALLVPIPEATGFQEK